MLTPSSTVKSHRLRNLRLREISVVDKPANEHATILLMKRATAPTATADTLIAAAAALAKLTPGATSATSTTAPSAGVIALEKAMRRFAGVAPDLADVSKSKTCGAVGLDRALARLAPRTQQEA